MKRKHLKRAAATALDLAADLAGCLPARCQLPAEDLVPVVWPLALRLTRLEVRADRHKRHAKAYRKAVKCARREVEQLLASQDGAVVRLPDLLRTIPFSADMWRLSLVPGAPVGVAAETEAEAA